MQECAEPKPDDDPVDVDVEVFGTPWGYDEHNGPAVWPEVWPVANGRRQSPIDLHCDTSSFDGSEDGLLRNDGVGGGRKNRKKKKKEKDEKAG